ncbi:MAG: methyl-accepting chemotaxis protein [Bacillota bacterium]
MLKVLNNLLNQLEGILRPFTKLKVFYQILIIIILMVIFLGIQGYTSINIINKIEKSTEGTFNRGYRQLMDISMIKQYLHQIQTSYLETLADRSLEKANTFNSLAQLDQIRSGISVTRTIGQEHKKMILEKLDSIKNLINEPANLTGYESLKHYLDEINSGLDKTSTAVLESALKTISNSYIFTTISKRNTIIIMVVSSLFSVLIGMLIVKSLSKPLKAMVEAAKLLAVGDLSKNVTISGSPEVFLAVKELNKAIAGLRELVKNINEQSDFILTASKELKDTSNESGRSASEVANAMEELAKASSEQTEQINQAVETIHLLAELVTKVSTEMGNIASTSEMVTQSAKLGQEVTHNIITEINELYDYTNELAEVIMGLSKTSDEITEITSVIGGISEQTGLLALNASIEAARAGEHGRGFGVVAAETGKLAEQSKQAAKLIADLLVLMKTRTSHAVEVIQSGIQKVESGKKMADETTITLETIFQNLRNTLNQINIVVESSKEMALKNDSMIKAISMIAAISEESMASTQEVSAIAEEQSASVEEVAALAENLTQIAQNLRYSMSTFNLEQSNPV